MPHGKRVPQTDTERWCKGCNLMRPRTAFYSRRDGQYSPECRECTIRRSMAYQASRRANRNGAPQPSAPQPDFPDPVPPQIERYVNTWEREERELEELRRSQSPDTLHSRGAYARSASTSEMGMPSVHVGYYICHDGKVRKRYKLV